LIHEVAYGGLLHERQRALHAKIVDTIESLAHEQSYERVEELARHALLGELWDKACTNLRLAGVRALSRPAFEEAAAHFERALFALSHLPETSDRLEHAIDVRFELRHALFPLGQPEKGLHYLREAETLARKLGDRRRLGWVSAYMCYYLLPNNVTESVKFGEEARTIADGLGDLRLRTAGSYYVGLAYYNTGDYQRAASAFQDAIELLDDELGRERCGLLGFPVSVCRSWLALSVANLGAFDEATAYGVEGLRLAEALGHPYTRIVAYRILASVFTLRGDQGHALDLLDHALALARDRHVTDLIPGVCARLGYVLILTGRVTEGLALLSEAVGLNEAIGRRGSHSLLMAFLGEGYAIAGELEGALVHARRAVAHAQEHGERGEEAYALRLQGDVLAQLNPGDIEAAAACFRQAMALAGELGMRPLVARCHLGMTLLWRQMGRHQEADKHRRAALALFSDLGMPRPADLDQRDVAF
jgi:tetratricopeptide (TPR) repeat protein